MRVQIESPNLSIPSGHLRHSCIEFFQLHSPCLGRNHAPFYLVRLPFCPVYNAQYVVAIAIRQYKKIFIFTNFGTDTSEKITNFRHMSVAFIYLRQQIYRRPTRHWLKEGEADKDYPTN